VASYPDNDREAEPGLLIAGKLECIKVACGDGKFVREKGAFISGSQEHELSTQLGN